MTTTCAIRKGLPDSITRTTSISGEADIEFPPEAAKLVVDGDRRICPCGAVYVLEWDQDHDHFYPNTYETLRRCT